MFILYTRVLSKLYNFLNLKYNFLKDLNPNFVKLNYIKMGLLFTTPSIEVLETNLNNILMINNETEIIEDTVYDVEDFYIIESNL